MKGTREQLKRIFNDHNINCTFYTTTTQRTLLSHAKDLVHKEQRNNNSVNKPDILTPTSRNVHETTEDESLNDEQMIDENERRQENNTPINTEQESYTPANAEAQELFDRIKEKLDNYFQNYKEMDLENREFTTRISRNVSSLQWAITDEIVDKHRKNISEGKEVDLWDLNVCYYVSAVMPGFR